MMQDVLIFQKYPINLPKKYLKNFHLDSWNVNIDYISRNDDKVLSCFSRLITSAIKNKMKCSEERLNRDYSYFANKTDRSNDFFRVLKNLSIFNNYIKDNINDNINFKSHNYDNQLNQFIFHYIFEYNVPACFYNFWRKSYSIVENPILERTILIGNGTSARKVYGLSKTENKYLYETNYPFDSELGFLVYLFARAQGCNIDLSMEISSYFDKKTFANYDKSRVINFSRRFCTWLSKQPLFDYNCITEILDYIINGNNIDTFNLSGRNINSMIRLCEEWHNELTRENTRNDNSSWDEFGLSYTLNDSIKFIELTKAQELKKEGQSQCNCVYSYINSCKSGRCAIVSLRSDVTPRVTIEINLNNNSIVQMKEKYNRVVSKENLNFINQYANEMKLSIRK